MDNETKTTTTFDRTALDDLLVGLDRSGQAMLYLMAGRRPFIRVQGKTIPSQGPALDAASIEDLTREFLFQDQRDCVAAGQTLQFLYTARNGQRHRATVLSHEDGLCWSFRPVPGTVPTFEELNLPELVSSFVEFESGIVLITGFLGSGKTTTMAAMTDRINRTTQSHIMTVERPIEFVYQPAAGIVHQRQVGIHVDSYARGIQEAVRFGAEVLVVGDLSDHETLLRMLEAAEKGILVLTTYHASSVVASLHGLLALCPVDQRPHVRVRLASALRVVMAQSLVRRAQTTGRVPLLEILINNQSVRQQIRNGNLQELPKLMEKSRGLGMQTVDQALRALVSRKLISVEEALYHASSREAITGQARGPVAAAR
jgi:twitching motility protein PilT